MRVKFWFKVNFIGEVNGLYVWIQVFGGDLGYDEIVKMLVELVFSFVFDKLLLKCYGIVILGFGIGVVLIDWLQKVGIEF